MTTGNRWGTYKNNLVVWHIEFPPRLRWRAELSSFADTVFDLGRREEVLCADEVLRASAQDLELFAGRAPTARVSVFGRAGIEERTVCDLGAELLALRPELPHVPHVPALSISGSQSLYRSDPAYVTISLDTDIWFPRVVGINEDDVRFYDNSPLAARHTPRLNRFLAGVRDAAAAIGGEWSYEVNNRRYEDQITDAGIVLDQSVTADRVAAWGTTICTAATTDPAELLFELGIPGTVVPRNGAFGVEPPPPGTTELTWSEHVLGFAWLEARFADTILTRASLDARLGPGVDVPRVHPGTEFSVSYRVDVPDAPYSCVIYAKYVDDPTRDTAACEVIWRRDPARRM